MKGFTKKRMACTLLFTLLCAAAPAAGFGDEPNIFPWLTYTLCVTLCTDEIDSQTKAVNPAPPGFRLVRVRFEGIDGDVAYDDINGKRNGFTLWDPDGNAYDAFANIVFETNFDGGKPTISPMQEKFDYLFMVAGGAALDNLTLRVVADGFAEPVAVPMYGVPRDES